MDKRKSTKGEICSNLQNITQRTSDKTPTVINITILTIYKWQKKPLIINYNFLHGLFAAIYKAIFEIFNKLFLFLYEKLLCIIGMNSSVRYGCNQF
jgi:hypothetical protein